ncbi:MAG: HlyD family secretion protein [Planctomycetota bacterium]|jgi:multidrug efflux pump subunit AcrA (membrane-fusion protein)
MKRISLRNYPFRLRLHLLPILVWLGAVACVIGLFTRRSQRFEIIGMARSPVVHVSVNCPAKLKAVPVRLFENVSKGQTVAIVDTVLDNEQPRVELQTQLDAILAEIEHLSAQLIPTQETLLAEESDREINRITRMRTFDVDIENARIQILSLRSQIASDRIVLEDLAMEAKITRDLVEQKAIAPIEHEKAQVQYDALAKKIEENEKLLEQAKSDLEQTQQRRDEYAKSLPFNPSVDDALEVIRKQIAVQDRLVKGVLAQIDALKARETLEVKAPIDGIIIPIQQQANEALMLRPGEKIMGQPGEVVTAGEPILAIAEVMPNEIVAYIGEGLFGQVEEEMPVEIIKERDPPQIARSQITEIGPTIELMPERMWLNPNIPQWGRPVLIEFPEGLELVPGEMIGIRIL